MQINIVNLVVFFLMVFMLALQLQLSDLSTKIQEINKKVEGLLKERKGEREKINITTQKYNFRFFAPPNERATQSIVIFLSFNQ